jgi:hypothetical protein
VLLIAKVSVIDEGTTVEHNDPDKQKLKNSRGKTLSHGHSATNPTCTGLRSNPDLQNAWPMTDTAWRIMNGVLYQIQKPVMAYCQIAFARTDYGKPFETY